MFARVISAQAGDEGFDDVIRLANEQLEQARRWPGFAGYLLLTDDDTGDVVIISTWQTREAMEAVAEGTQAGIHDEGVSAVGLRSMRLQTFEVAVRA